MTTRESFRQAVVTAVEARKALWSDYPLVIEYDNRILVDTQTQSNPFLCVEIHYIGGEQVDLGGSPNHRVYGQLTLAAAVKEGSGSKQANDLLEHFFPALHLTTIDGARMWGAKPEKTRPHRGWVYSPVSIPFDFDTTA